MDINTCDKYNFESLILEKPKKNDDVYLSSISNSSTTIQTPKLTINKLTKKLTLLLNEPMEKLFNDFDSKIVSLISEKSKDFFEEQLSIEDTEEIYKHSIRQTREETKITVSLNKNLTIYNKHKENLDVSTICKDDNVICLLKCKKIVFYKNYCEPLWEVLQIKLKEPELDLKKYLFIDDKDDNYIDDNDNDDNLKDIKKIKMKV